MRRFESTPIRDSGFIVRWQGEFADDFTGVRVGTRVQNPQLRFEAGDTIRVAINSVSLSAWVQLDKGKSGQLVILPFGVSADETTDDRIPSDPQCDNG